MSQNNDDTLLFKGQRYYLAAIIILVIFSALILTYDFRKFTNTLHANGKWESSKTLLEKSVAGAASFMLTPDALFSEHLNLGKWWGNQEILSRKSFILKRVEFDFFLSSRLAFVFDKTEKGFRGLVFNSLSSPSLFYFQASPSGAFTKKTEFPAVAISQGWNHLVLEFTNEATVLTLNDVTKIFLDKKNDHLQKIGFRSFDEELNLIDSVRIFEKSVDIPLIENFEAPYSFCFVFLVMVLILIGGDGLLFLLVFRGDSKYIYKLAATFHLVVLIIITIFTLGIHYYYYKLPIGNRTEVRRHPAYSFTVENGDVAMSRLDLEISQLKNDTSRKILLVGASQVWGAGAFHESESIGYLLNEKIKKTPNLNCYKLVDASVCGNRTDFVLRDYQAILKKANPAYVVLALGHNEMRENFEKNLNLLVTILLHDKAIPILVAGPDQTSLHVRENSEEFMYSVLKKTALDFNLRYISLAEIFYQNRETGFLFWDWVHLTSYGQQIFAESLFSDLKLVLPNCTTRK